MFTLFVFGFLWMNEVNVLTEVFDMLIKAMNIAHNYKNDQKRGKQQPLKEYHTELQVKVFRLLSIIFIYTLFHSTQKKPW